MPSGLLRCRAAAAALVAVGTLAASLLGPLTTTPVLAATATSSSTATNAPAVGYDISWPNCPKGMGIPARRSEGEPMPPTSTGFVVIGLTNGPGFYPNPCLNSQVAWAEAHHLRTGQYAMTTFPSSAEQARYATAGPWHGADTLTRIRNAGYAEARFNVLNAAAAGLTGRFIWVDVEDYPVAPWTGSTTANRAAIQGVLRGYTDAGYHVGVYSIVGMWNRLTGSWRPGLPLWDAVGSDGPGAAARRCHAASFIGGPRWMTQWTSGHHDLDVTCPGVTGTRAAASPLAPYRTTRLRYGYRGPAVTALQRALRVHASGVFDRPTRAKVVAFQRAHHLPADGVVDGDDYHALEAYAVTPATAGLMPALFATS